jgi:hypothetical protein
LGLGVLSVAPSQADLTNLTVTVTNGTATTLNSDSSTAAVISLNFLALAGSESVTVGVAQRTSLPTDAVIGGAAIMWTDSSTATAANTPTFDTATALNSVRGSASTIVRYTRSPIDKGVVRVLASSTANLVTTTKFKVDLGETTTSTIKSGTYGFTAVVTHSVGGVVTTVTKDFDIVVSAVASQSKVASTGTSTAVLSSGSSYAPATAGVDDVVGALATASTTAAATLRVSLKNASSNPAQESITAAVTGAGVIGDGTTFGKSVVLVYSAADYAAGYKDLSIRPDGSAGTSTVTVSSTSVTFAPKSINFYAKSPKTITAKINNPVLNVGANTKAVSATAVDANGIAWTGQLYIVASAAADALVGGSATTPKACTWTPAKGVHYCPVTTLIAGTASFKVVDETLDTDADDTTYVAADSAATSDAVSLTVSNGTPASVKLAFDKATYAPFEKAIITVTPLDAAGKTMGTKAITNLFATGGISSNVAFGSSSDTLTGVTLTTSEDNSSTAPRTAGAFTYIVYMPAQGTVTISATGGTGLAAAGQVAVTATADVVNSSVDAATDAANEATDAANAATDAALAAADAADAATAAAQDASDAVAALSATVAKLVASLKAQITSLTNLVIKIQKKVKA